MDAWLIASADLDVRVTVPYSLPRSTGDVVPYLLLIHGFGSRLGTLLCTTNDEWDDAWEVAESYGFYSSALNPIHYSTYDREAFAATLADWGWYGEGQPPSWYNSIPPRSPGAG